MSTLAIVMVFLLAAVETLASYMSRVYSEFGKILAREVQENLDGWEEQIEPQLGLSREHAAISAAVLQQLALGIIALEFGAVLFDRGPRFDRPTSAEIAQAAWGSFSLSSSAISFCRLCSSIARVDAGSGRWCGQFGCFCG